MGGEGVVAAAPARPPARLRAAAWGPRQSAPPLLAACLQNTPVQCRRLLPACASQQPHTCPWLPSLPACLQVGQPMVVGAEWGRVRSLRGTGGATVEEVLPGQPAEIAGLKGLPQAGDQLLVRRGWRVLLLQTAPCCAGLLLTGGSVRSDHPGPHTACRLPPPRRLHTHTRAHTYARIQPPSAPAAGGRQRRARASDQQGTHVKRRVPPARRAGAPGGGGPGASRRRRRRRGRRGWWGGAAAHAAADHQGGRAGGSVCSFITHAQSIQSPFTRSCILTALQQHECASRLLHVMQRGSEAAGWWEGGRGLQCCREGGREGGREVTPAQQPQRASAPPTLFC